MGRLLLRLAVLLVSVGIFVALVANAALTVGCEGRPPATAATLPDAASPPPSKEAVAPDPPEPKPLYHLRMPASKADPHLARMLAEEAAKTKAFEVMKKGHRPSGAPR